jgi:hypothetical protein
MTITLFRCVAGTDSSRWLIELHSTALPLAVSVLLVSFALWLLEELPNRAARPVPQALRRGDSPAVRAPCQRRRETDRR